MTDNDADTRIDERLREDGRRWRADHDAAVRVDLEAVTRGRGGRRSMAWHARWAAPVAAAAVVAVVIGMTTFAGRGSSPDDGVAAGPAASGAVSGGAGSAEAGSGTAGSGPQQGEAATGNNSHDTGLPASMTALLGGDWQLERLQPNGKPAMDSVAAATLRFPSAESGSWSGAGPASTGGAAVAAPGGDTVKVQVAIGDGCAAYSGPVSVTATTMTFGELEIPAIGCPDRPDGFAEQRELINHLVSGTDPVTWAIDGDELTLTRPGVVTVTYGAGSGPTPASSSHSAPTDPADVFTGRWQLDTIQSALSGTGPGASVSARAAPPDAFVRFDNGALTGSNGCTDFGAGYTADASTLTVGDLIYPDPKPCPSGHDWPNILQGRTTWTAGTTGDGPMRLTITAANGAALAFTASDGH